MSGAPLQVTRGDDGVAVLTIENGKGNVFDRALMAALRDALRALAAEPTLRAVVLSAAGRHFSFGASIAEHRAAEAPAMLSEFHSLIREVAASPVPLVAAVQGRCLGGAFEVVLACHLVVAAADARFGCPEIALGVFPPVLAALGPLRLGGARAERLLLTGEEIGAEEAHTAGLVAAIAPSGLATTDAADAAAPPLAAWARAFAVERFGGRSAFALRQAVIAARRGAGVIEQLGAPLAAIERQYLEALLPSHDGNEGIEAYLERRPPRWRHA